MTGPSNIINMHVHAEVVQFYLLSKLLTDFFLKYIYLGMHFTSFYNFVSYSL